jgi:branched-chain amino acid transport system permease protein
MFWGRVTEVSLSVITLTVALILYKLFNATAGDAYHIGKAALAMQLQPAPAVGTRWN